MSAYPQSAAGSFPGSSTGYPRPYSYMEHYQNMPNGNGGATSPIKNFEQHPMNGQMPPGYPQYANGMPAMSSSNSGPYPGHDMRQYSYPGAPQQPPQQQQQQQQQHAPTPTSMPQMQPQSTGMPGSSNQMAMMQNPMMQQMKSPMPGVQNSQGPSPMSHPIQQPPTPQGMNQGMFAAPHPRQKMAPNPSPSPSHMPPAHHPHQMMGAPPPVPTSSAMPSHHDGGVPGPPTQDTPFTAVTHYDMPPAFQNKQDEFKRINPSLSNYYDRPRSLLPIAYPQGNNPAPAREPPTFGFLRGQQYYNERFDRNKPQMSPAHMQQLQQQHNAAMQQQMNAPPQPAKKKRTSSSGAMDPPLQMYPQQSMPNNPMQNRPAPPMYSKAVGMQPMSNSPHMSYGSMPPSSEAMSMHQYPPQGAQNMMPPQQGMNGVHMQMPNGSATTPNYSQRPQQQPSHQMPPPCPNCKNPIQAPAVQCNGNCRQYYHQACSGINDRARALLEAETYAKWVCDRCSFLAM